MLFNSIPFVFFFIVVTVLYFMLPHRYRWVLLLAASCFFYMFFKPVYILILAFTIVIDYYAGILLEDEPDKVKKKKYLVMSLIANIGVLAVFKYYNFLNGNVSELAQMMGFTNHMPFLRIALPIGLSFHTFQAMSYTIEVYRGNHKAERHFGIYSLYVMFYPQLVAGPIERPQNMLHQFHEEKFFNYNNAVTGLRLMMWGMFKKVVIADRLAVVTDPVFDHPGMHSSLNILVAAVFFSIEIYCDFSGYSDIAIGSARIMGFKLMNNFSQPYNAKSISEFWRRWHISLSTWFKDYLYIPLGGNRVSRNRRNFNLFLVFLVSGFWHGANWTYIVWGAIHGFYMVFADVTAPVRNKLRAITGIAKAKLLDSVVQRVLTFSLVTIAWVFFRANTMHDALYILGRLPDAFREAVQIITRKIPMVKFPIADARMEVCLLVIVLLEVVHAVQKKRSINTLIQNQPRIVRWSVYYAIVFIIVLFGIFHDRQFIYFQF
ncbi:MAG: poly(beta-D-mannuronate) O-acetylase [Flavipsychrobacter sp.]|nr:poly(beta-D-mannuronate) O-acetylase [Flavipsychrobacter sp.]